MNRTQDYYDVLGVSHGASTKEIRQAYKRLARKYHPDVNPGDKAVEERFKAITEAHTVLSDPEKRKQYDQFGRAYESAQQSGQWQGGNFEDFLRQVAGAGGGVTIGGSFGDIFGDLFGRATRGATPAAGRRAGPRAPQRGEDIEHEIEIPFEEAMSGTEKAISLTLSDRCPKCNGVGGSTVPCSACGGTGAVRQAGGFPNLGTPCPQCQSTGEQVTSRCPRCGGSGEVTRARRIRVKIPPGVRSDQRILIRGEGAAGINGGPAGSLVLRARVGTHRLFERRGDDIHVEVPVKFTEAALGAEIEVPSVWGSAKLKIPPDTKNGQTLRLRGMGAPKVGGTARGDELVKVVIATPSKLTHRQRELLEEFETDWTDDPRAGLRS
jgi:molecular chaperone DnaJ